MTTKTKDLDVGDRVTHIGGTERFNNKPATVIAIEQDNLVIGNRPLARIRFDDPELPQSMSTFQTNLRSLAVVEGDRVRYNGPNNVLTGRSGTVTKVLLADIVEVRFSELANSNAQPLSVCVEHLTTEGAAPGVSASEIVVCGADGPSLRHIIATSQPRAVQAVAVTTAGNTLVAGCHGAAVAAGWWNDLHTGASLIDTRNVPEMLCLIHSEISEAMEGHRKNLMDDKLPQYPMLAVELADAVIRIADLAGSRGFPLGEIIAAKMAYNANRADHKPEARKAAGGKAF